MLDRRPTLRHMEGCIHAKPAGLPVDRRQVKHLIDDQVQMAEYCHHSFDSILSL